MYTGNCIVLILGVWIFMVNATAYGSDTKETLWGREFSRSEDTESIYYLDFQSRSERIEITVITEIGRQMAEQMIAEKVFLFGSLFERQRVGYPGQHTEYIECPPEFKPAYNERSVDGGMLRYFRGFASSRFAFGACDEESASYAAVNAYLHCSDAMILYDINYFALNRSEDDAQAFANELTCE